MVETTGNTLLGPPRRTGRTEEDISALFDWARDLFAAIALEQNTIGTVEALNIQVPALLARIEALEAKMQAIAELAYMPGSVSATYTAAELAAAYDKINAILAIAKGA